MFRFTLILTFFLCAFFPIFAQKTIALKDFTLSYPDCAEGDTAYAYLQIFSDKNIMKHRNVTLLKKDNFKAAHQLPQNAAFVWVVYYSTTCGQKDEAFLLTDENGKPQVFSTMMNEEIPLRERLDKELSIHPKSYAAAAYALSIDFSGDSFDEKYIQQLSEKVKNDNSTEALVLKARIAAKTKQFDVCADLLREFAEKYPDSEHFLAAFASLYQMRDNPKVFNELNAKRIAFIKKNYQKDAVINLFNGGFDSNEQIDAKSGIEIIENLLKNNFLASTLQYSAKSRLVNYYIEAKKLEQAEKLVSAIMNDKTMLLNACLGNKKRIWETSFNLKNQLCFINEERGKLDAALLLRMKNLDEYRSSEYSKNSPTSPVTYERLLLGTMIKMNLLALAERKIKEIYPEAYPDKGELELLMEQIAKFYVKKTGTQDGFFDFMKTVHVNIPSEIEKNAKVKSFVFNTLTNKTYTEKDAAGKVFVLNFWDTFCAPCIREMPDLNEVVKHFSGNSDVIFVAPSPSEKAALEKFFETPKMKFDYQIAYGAEEMLKTFEIQAIPVHIVFDKKGEIVLRQTGATPDITKQLIAAIEEALKAK